MDGLQPHTVIMDEVLDFRAPITCDWDEVVKGAESCDHAATYRAGMSCCQDWSLICTHHAALLLQWTQANAHGVVDCPIHGSASTIAEVFHVHKI